MGPAEIASAVAAFLAIAWLVKVIATGDDDRHAEDQARAYFDRHGHWPDEKPPSVVD